MLATVILGLVVFVSAALQDRLACAWYDARDRGDRRGGVLIGLLLEALGWLPLVVTLDGLDIRVAIFCSLAGTAVGTTLGLRRGACNVTRE
jgi:hypothetical protein